MQGIFAYLFIFVCASLELISGEHEDAFGVHLYNTPPSRTAQVTTFDVTSFGAVGDGTTDDSKVIAMNPSPCYKFF